MRVTDAEGAVFLAVQMRGKFRWSLGKKLMTIWPAGWWVLLSSTSNVVVSPRHFTQHYQIVRRSNVL